MYLKQEEVQLEAHVKKNCRRKLLHSKSCHLQEKMLKFRQNAAAKEGNCRIKQLNKINPLNLAVIHNRTTRSTPRKVASLKKRGNLFSTGCFNFLILTCVMQLYRKREIFLKLQSTS